MFIVPAQGGEDLTKEKTQIRTSLANRDHGAAAVNINLLLATKEVHSLQLKQGGLIVDFAVVTHSEIETRRLGTIVARCLPRPAVIGLVGTLGAGKTRLVQGIAWGCGVHEAAVISPTFVLIHEYPGEVPVFHFDVYRLRDVTEFLDLGPDEYFLRPGISVIEWADRVQECLPLQHLIVEIEIVSDSDRRFLFRPAGQEYLAAVDRILEKWNSDHTA